MQLRARYGANILGLVPGKVITLPGPLLEDAKDNSMDSELQMEDQLGLLIMRTELG